MFSFNQGAPVAYIDGGEYNTRILRLMKDAQPQPDIKATPIMRLKEDWFTYNFPKIRAPAINAVVLALNKGVPPADPTLRDIYELAKRHLDKSLMYEFVVEDDGMLSPVVNQSTPDRIYIAGPSGAGKSVMTGKYMKIFNFLFPDRKIYVFSRIEEDHALDSIENVVRIPINLDLMDRPIVAEQLANSLVVIDDIDTIVDAKLAEAVRKMRDDLLECGRHFNTYVICTSHRICDAKKTKVMLNESTAVIFFPQSGASQQIKRFMAEYVGVSTKSFEKIMRLPSRWVAVYKHYPQYILYEKGAFLLHAL